MNSILNIFNSVRAFVHLSPLHQFLLNILIPFCGIIFLDWTPGNVLFCFGIELVNYWLCNLILLLFYAKEEYGQDRIKNALQFSFYFLASMAGFYWFIRFISDRTNDSMQISLEKSQIIPIVALYWLQFIYYLYVAKPKGKAEMDEINKEVTYRLTGIYLILFCIIMYVFSFWSNTNVMNYALAFSLIFARSLMDLVMIARKVVITRHA